MREDDRVMSQRSAHDVEASTLHAALPAHFDEAQAEQALWQEFRHHDASNNNALTEALRVHGSHSWLIFQVGVLRWIRGSLSHPLCVRVISDSAFSRVPNCW
jgi:hypothetical protein